MDPEAIRKILEDEADSASDLEDFSGGSSEEFVPSSGSSSSKSEDDTDDEVLDKFVLGGVSSSIVNEDIEDDIGDEVTEAADEVLVCNEPADIGFVSQPDTFETNFIWSTPDEYFVPKKTIFNPRSCKIADHIPRHSSIIDIFNKLLPRSAYIFIAQCTNERIKIFESEQPKTKKVKIAETNAGKIKTIVGCMFVMCYNRLPSLKDYWSCHKSLGNQSLKEAITRDRFTFVTSKMYFAQPDKPHNSNKTYYIDDLVECLKNTFQKCRQDSVYQSIDESMTKFKGRSTLKQYMPLKPVKRGIKMWLRCDAFTGYTYDFNIYHGKDMDQSCGTLGERVVSKLASSIAETDVVLCFDRFFTFVNLLDTISFPAVGTVMANRKNLPKFSGNKLKRGESEFKSTSSGLLCAKWQDTKEVLVLSNCHDATVTTVTKALKTGEKIEVPCPNLIKSYREIMGGVDLGDQMSGLYDYDRKSDKWWKKTFYRLIMMTAVNAWVIYNDLNRNKIPFKLFLVTLSEALIEEGLKTTAVRRSMKPGRAPQAAHRKSMHLPVEGTSRRRCSNCSAQKKQTRTKTICKECQVPL